jgi:hypothetical protein
MSPVSLNSSIIISYLTKGLKFASGCQFGDGAVGPLAMS